MCKVQIRFCKMNTHIQNIIENGESMLYESIISEAIDYIENNLCEDLTLETLSKQFYYSKDHFYRIFRLCVNCTIKEYVSNLRLLRATSLLVNSDENILNIALIVGYNSHEVFTRNFKRGLGMTPRDYRKSSTRIYSYESTMEIS